MHTDNRTAIDGRVFGGKEREIVLAKATKIVIVDPILKLVDGHLVARRLDFGEVLIHFPLCFGVTHWDRDGGKGWERVDRIGWQREVFSSLRAQRRLRTCCLFVEGGCS